MQEAVPVLGYTIDGVEFLSLSKINNTDEWLYQYSAADALEEIQHNGQLLGDYTYAGNGNRIKKTEWNENLQQYEIIIYSYSTGKGVLRKEYNHRIGCSLHIWSNW